MILDNEQQRQMLLNLIAVTSVPGNALEVVLELKHAIQRASVAAKLPNEESTE